MLPAPVLCFLRSTGLMDNIDKEGGNVYSILGMISHINDFPQELKGKKIACYRMAVP